MRHAYKDRAVGQLQSGIASTDDNMTLLSGQGAKFPSDVSDAKTAILTLVKFSTPNDPFSAPVYWEKVKVNEISSDTFGIIERGVGDTTPQGFGAGDYVFLNLTEDFINGIYTELDQGLDYRKNWVLDGGFIDWQQGESFTDPSDNKYTATMWRVNRNADGGTYPTVVHTKQSENGSPYYRINANGAGSSLGNNSAYILSHLIPHGVRNLCGAGKKITIAFKAKSNIASKKIGVFAVQNYGTGGSPTSEETLNGNKFTLTNSWADYAITINTNTLNGKTFGTDLNDYLQLAFQVQWGSSKASRVGDTVVETFVGSGNIEIDEIRLISGDTIGDFVHEDISMLKVKISTFFRRLKVTGQWLPIINTRSETSTLSFIIPLGIPMIKAPTVTINGTRGTAWYLLTLGNVVEGDGSFASASSNELLAGFAFTGGGFSAGTYHALYLITASGSVDLDSRIY